METVDATFFDGYDLTEHALVGVLMRQDEFVIDERLTEIDIFETSESGKSFVVVAHHTKEIVLAAIRRKYFVKIPEGLAAANRCIKKGIKVTVWRDEPNYTDVVRVVVGLLTDVFAAQSASEGTYHVES